MIMSAAQVNAQIPVGVWRDDHHRYFYGSRGPLPSVTTIIGIVDKSGPLTGWAKRETAACAIRNLDMLAQMVKDGGREAAEAWLAKIPDRIRDDAAAVGTSVHAMVEADLRGEDISPTGVEVPYMRAWRRFCQSIGLTKDRVIASEVMLVNLTLGYGGTLDLGLMLDGEPTLIDIKTGRNVYDEVALQIAGYDLGEGGGTPSDPNLHPLPQWKRHGVLHLQPDDWSLIPVDINDQTREAFKACLAAWDWSKHWAPYVKGRPLKEQQP